MILNSCRIYHQQNLILVSVRHQPHLPMLGHICICSAWYKFTQKRHCAWEKKLLAEPRTGSVPCDHACVSTNTQCPSLATSEGGSRLWTRASSETNKSTSTITPLHVWQQYGVKDKFPFLYFLVWALKKSPCILKFQIELLKHKFLCYSTPHLKMSWLYARFASTTLVMI